MLFTGYSEHVIDSKGRLTIPAQYRAMWKPERDGEAWYCVVWPDGTLRLYTERRYEELANQDAQQLAPSDEMARFETDFFGLTKRLEWDSEGRITLPKDYLKRAQLGSEVVVVGARNRLEVRDRAAWLESIEQRFTQLPAVVERKERAKKDGPSGG